MEAAGSAVAYPSLDQIVDVNRQMIYLSGGDFVGRDNLRNRQSLEYILAAIAHPIFGRQLFPTLKDKAAALAFEIITAHVFMDGNKRTGIHIAWEFLQSNDVPLILDGSIEELAVILARGEGSREQLLKWLHNHQDTPPAQ